MPTKSITHNFKYTKEDIEGLIKADIAKQLGRDTIPIIKYQILFDVGLEDRPDDWRAEFAQITVMHGAFARVEVPG